MSDLCLYEFEDTVWDEFCQSDDHIVPHPVLEQADDRSLLGDRHKKPRFEVTNISYSSEDRSSAGYVDQECEERGSTTLSRTKNTMLEKDTWPRTPSGVFTSSDGEIKEASNLTSGNTTSSIHAFKNNKTNLNGNEFCGNNTILGDKTAEVDINSSGDQLGDITHVSDHLDFFENPEDKDSSDFLYYCWPEIENFEDVDRMFRNCDTTFGLAASKEDELGWFSSADNIGGSGDVKSHFKFSCPESNPVENTPPEYESSKSHSVDDSATTSVPIRLKDSPWSDSYMPFVTGPAFEGKEGFIPKANMIEHQKQVKRQNQSVGTGKEHDFENGSFSYMSKHPHEVAHLPSKVISHRSFPAVRVQQQQKVLGPDSCNYLLNHPSYVPSDSSPLSDLTSVNLASSAVKSENNDLRSSSPRDSSNASSQFPSTHGSRDPSLTVTALTGTGKREKLHNHQGSRSSVGNSIKQENPVVQGALDDPGSIAKEVQYSGDKSENHSNIEGVGMVTPVELGSSNMQQSSTMSSGMDDISLEAASFRQLQLVMEQLDLRTKICIRDSLYRLARSAEQRHNHANLNGSLDEGDGSGAFMAEGENNFMDIETDTNPIDRSVAHLLFHRPWESSPMPAHDSLPFKSPSTVHGSVTSPPVMVENLVTSEETASEIKISDR